VDPSLLVEAQAYDDSGMLSIGSAVALDCEKIRDSELSSGSAIVGGPEVHQSSKFQRLWAPAYFGNGPRAICTEILKVKM